MNTLFDCFKLEMIEQDKILNKNIIKLCLKHGLRFEVVGHYIKIISKYDTWFLKNLDENKNYTKIVLEHESKNPVYGKNKFAKHKQKEVFRNYEQIFEYINRHDNKFLTNHDDKLFNITELLKQIEK
ncbi:MAG: hypothetical protein ACM3O3_13135 [Syntrophothermus sp.]